MLPKISYPLFDVTLPSNGKKVKIRPMLVKEEKILLIARETTTIAEKYTAIKQVVNNCVVTDKFDVEDIPIIDIEWLFIKIRSYSIGNIIKVTYQDNADDKEYTVEIDIDQVKINKKDDVKNVIKVNDEISFTMKHPSGAQYDDEEFLTSDNGLFLMTIKCIDSVFDGESIIKAKDCTRQELEDFIDSLPTKVNEEIVKWFLNTPSLEYKMEYTNSLGDVRKITLSKLEDFFMF